MEQGKKPEHCIVRLYKPETGWETILEEQQLDSTEPFNRMMKEYIKAIKGESHILQSGVHALNLLSTTISARNNNNG